MKVNKPKHLILEAVGKFQYLSAFQLTRLLFSPTVLTYTQSNASELVKADYLRRVLLPTGGRPQAFYCLSAKGYKYLGDPTLPDPPKFRDSNEPYRNALFILHTEAANDLVILGHNLPRADSRFTLIRSKTEAQIKKQRVKVKPDGWIELYAQKTAAVCFEMDRGTEGVKDWKEKIKAYSPYLRGPYQQDYGVSHYPTVAIVTTTPRRMNDLLDWTEQALAEVNDFEMASLLYFSSFNPVEITPVQAFLSPIWVTPESRGHQQLLPEDISG